MIPLHPQIGAILLTSQTEMKHKCGLSQREAQGAEEPGVGRKTKAGSAVHECVLQTARALHLGLQGRARRPSVRARVRVTGLLR